VVNSPSNSNWLSVTPASGNTPSSLTVSVDPTGLGQGSYYGTITISVAGSLIYVSVNFQIGPRLSASATSISLTAPVAGVPQNSQPVTVTSTSTASYQISVSPANTWLTASPTSGTTPGTFYITANPSGMAAGIYTGTVTISASGAVNTVTIPVSFSVTSPTAAVVSVSPTTLSFSYQPNGATPAALTLTATAASQTGVYASASGGNWLTVTPNYSQTPATFSVSVAPAGLAGGVYSGTVTITSTGNQINVPVTLTVQATPQLTLSAASLAFSATPGLANPPAQSIQAASTGAVLTFQATSSAAWLKVATTSNQTPAQINVSVDAGQLQTGVYTGTVTITSATGGTYTVSVVLSVSPLTLLTVSPPELNLTYVAGDSAPALLPLMLFSNAAIPYTVKVTGAPWLTLNGSSGTAPALLEAMVDPTNLAPGVYQASIQVTATGVSSVPAPVKVKLTVKSGAPFVYDGGIVNAASFMDGAVAPGSLVAIFGENFTELSQVAEQTPWPTKLGQVSVTVNGVAAALGMVSPGQIEAQIPSELGPGIARIVVSVNGQSSAPVMLPIAAAAPGIFSSGGGTAVQNADYSANSSTKPAPAGGVLVAYLTGQGALSGPLPSGSASPGSPFLTPALPVAASVDGKAAEVLFAGMAPGQVGVLQVNLKLPGMPQGEHLLRVMIGGVESNAVPVFIAAGQ
jgi:uncharacterized protein (TIGR03437 family)